MSAFQKRKHLSKWNKKKMKIQFINYIIIIFQPYLFFIIMDIFLLTHNKFLHFVNEELSIIEFIFYERCHFCFDFSVPFMYVYPLYIHIVEHYCSNIMLAKFRIQYTYFFTNTLRSWIHLDIFNIHNSLQLKIYTIKNIRWNKSNSHFKKREFANFKIFFK